MTLRFDRHLFQEEFGRRLRAERDKRDMSQVVLAALTGYVPQTISNLERGFTFPSLNAVIVFADVFKMHPKELLFGKE
jgi:transcriptional regulator with XRE-family HTH domain